MVASWTDIKSQLLAPNRFVLLGIVTILSIWLAIATEQYYLAGIPAAYLLGYLTLVDFRPVFYLLLLFIPLSTEIYLPNGFGTDLPTEPLMIGLMGVYLVYILRHTEVWRPGFIRHPITLLLLLHLAWIYFTALLSDNFFVSLKFSLAKTWYIVVFYFMTALIIRRVNNVKTYFWVIFSSLLFMTLVTLARHAAIGFSFELVHTVFSPFNRNHVNYAAIISLFLPWVVLAIGWYKKKELRWWLLIGSVGVLLLATYLSFTRAAYVTVLIMFGAYWIIRWRLVRYVLIASLIVAISGTAWILNNNRYLEFAPNFERTISHSEFDNLLSATAKGEDISTMERVYRWVAAYYMIKDQPVLGVGPGNFVNFYKEYTVTSFRTYVSDNKEQSGIHSYFLMTFVEQGLPGLIIFVLLLFFALLYGEYLYHRFQDSERKRIIMMALLSIISIASFLIINDLIETDKVGSFFFMNLAILVNQGIVKE